MVFTRIFGWARGDCEANCEGPGEDDVVLGGTARIPRPVGGWLAGWPAGPSSPASVDSTSEVRGLSKTSLRQGAAGVSGRDFTRMRRAG